MSQAVFVVAFLGLVGALGGLAYSVRAYHISSSPEKMRDRLKLEGYAVVERTAYDLLTGKIGNVVPGDVRRMAPLSVGHDVVYGGELCRVDDVQEDGQGGIQITLLKRTART